MSGHIDRNACCGMTAIVLVSMLSASIGAEAADESPASEGPKAAWLDGSARHDFVMDEQTLAIKPLEAATDDRVGRDGRARCILVVPKRPVKGNPWSWRDLYRDHQPPAEAELLARGFHLAFITPGPPRQREAWLTFLTENDRLSRRPVSVSMSGGELRAGTAKCSITPDDVKMPVHDTCFARSLVLDVGGERVAIVALDLGVYTSEHLVAACKERFGIMDSSARWPATERSRRFILMAMAASPPTRKFISQMVRLWTVPGIFLFPTRAGGSAK